MALFDCGVILLLLIYSVYASILYGMDIYKSKGIKNCIFEIMQQVAILFPPFAFLLSITKKYNDNGI